MAEQYTNIRVILDKILRHPLMQDMSLEIAIDYTIDFMRIVGCPNMFEEKVTTLDVNSYKAYLPDDYYQINQIKLDNITLRYSGDSFHMSNPGSKDLTYKIQGNFIYTSFEEGEIEVSYQAIATDEQGFPLIPDNSSFTRALELYIKKQWFTILFDTGKLHGSILSNVQQEYAWAVGDCQSEFNRLSIDKAESFYNSWRTLLIRDREHNKTFKNSGIKEYLKRR